MGKKVSDPGMQKGCLILRRSIEAYMVQWTVLYFL